MASVNNDNSQPMDKYVHRAGHAIVKSFLGVICMTIIVKRIVVVGTVAERRDRGHVAVQQRRGDRAGRFAVPHRENVGAPEPDAGQPDREQPGLAVGRRRAVLHAAADIRGQGAPVAAGRAGRGDAVAGAPAAVQHVQRGHGHQPDGHRRTVRRQDPQLLHALVPVLLLRPPPPEGRPTGARPVRYPAQGAHVRAARLPEAQEHGQAHQGQ